jgi:serine/threonine-protein kinase RsbW
MEPTTLELRVPSEIGNERYAMDFAEDVALQMGFRRDKIENLKIAVAEACLNAIEHGNSLNRNMKVVIDFTISSSQLEIHVKDRGNGFVPREIEKPNIREKVEGTDPESRGWGMFLIKNMVDEIEYRDAGLGTHLRMVVKLPLEDDETEAKG